MPLVAVAVAALPWASLTLHLGSCYRQSLSALEVLVRAVRMVMLEEHRRSGLCYRQLVALAEQLLAGPEELGLQVPAYAVHLLQAEAMGVGLVVAAVEVVLDHFTAQAVLVEPPPAATAAVAVVDLAVPVEPAPAAAAVAAAAYFLVVMAAPAPVVVVVVARRQLADLPDQAVGE